MVEKYNFKELEKENSIINYRSFHELKGIVSNLEKTVEEQKNTIASLLNNVFSLSEENKTLVEENNTLKKQNTKVITPYQINAYKQSAKIITKV